MSPDDGSRDGTGAIERVVVPLEGAPALPTDPKAIEDLIARRRDSLAATIDELVVRAHPREIARRSAADAKGRVQAFATTPDGGLRTERLAAVAGAALASLTLVLVLRRRRGAAR
jgi:hypothetical protein